MRHPPDPAIAGVRLVHTADLQIGKPFHGVPGDAGARLRERRLDVIETLGKAARDHHAEIVLVAGDFFDANTVDDRVVQQALSRVKQAGILFLVLPGNHDHGGTGSIYLRRSFRNARPENLVVLGTRAPCVQFGGRLVILPAPLLRQRELTDPTEHVTRDLGRAEAPSAIRVGLAHGSVKGFAHDADGRASNLIAADRAELAGLDYLALGDWHGTKRISDRTWYAGTPEPTGFKQNDPGFALLVDIAAPGAAPKVRPLPVAATRWLVREETMRSPEDVDHLGAWLDELGSPQDIALDLTIGGALPRADMARLEKLIEVTAARLLHLKLSSSVRPFLDGGDVTDIAADGFVRTAADRLHVKAASSDPAARTAEHALHTLYRLAVEAGGSAC